MNMTPRSAAVQALYAVQKNSAYADAEINRLLSQSDMDARARALASRLFYGVLQQRSMLDLAITRFCSVRIKKLHPRVLQILRVGLYQIYFCDRIPDYSAVSESVMLARATGNAAAAGLINAVLRRASGEPMPEPDMSDRLEYLSVKYSVPRPLAELLAESLGADPEPLFRTFNEAPPTCLRINRLRSTPALAAEIGAETDPVLPYCAYLRSGSAASLPQYAEGLMSIQDKSSQLAVAALAPRAGELLIDGCAAPGGKSLASAEAADNAAEIISCDIYEGKLTEISKNAARLGITCVTPCLQDAGEENPRWLRRADAVIADVPCSGLGVIRKKPDIRWKDASELAALPELQLRLLKNLSGYVKPGGRLMYSTCTLLRRENEETVRAFLAEAPDFTLVPFFAGQPPELRAPEGILTLWPHIHGTDGFFIALMKRKD